MAELVIQLDDEKLHKLEALAEEKNLILAEMLAEVLDGLLAQGAEPKAVYPDWIKGALFEGDGSAVGANADEISQGAWDTWEGAGMFHSGRTDTGANADEILAREWRPDEPNK